MILQMKEKREAPRTRKENTIRRLKEAKRETGKEINVGTERQIEKIIAEKLLQLRQSSTSHSHRASYRKVAARLNAEGIAKKEGSAWTPQDVYNVVNKRWRSN